MDYQLAYQKVISHPLYQRNVEFGEARPGHPEGKVKRHIADLEANLERLRPRIFDEDTYWKLKFLIHVHDTCKAQAVEGVPTEDPTSHESLARVFASEFTDDADMLNIIQWHDENFKLWRVFLRSGEYDTKHLEKLIHLIQDWDLFLLFTIVDGHTPGKDLEKLPWFIQQVKKYRPVRVEEDWTKLDSNSSY